jgi:hypothetical protein
VAPSCDIRHLHGRVLDGQDIQAGFGEETFVLTNRDEQSVADRGSDRDFVAPERAGHDQWVAEEQPTARPQQAKPVGNDPAPIGEMVDCVDAENRIERPAFERQRFAGVGPHEPRLRREARLEGLSVSRGHRLRIQLDADDLASRVPRQVERRAARPAGDVEKTPRRSEFQPDGEPLELVDREPTVLADVDAERRTANLRMHVSRELLVLSAVVTGGRATLTHDGSLVSDFLHLDWLAHVFAL